MKSLIPLYTHPVTDPEAWRTVAGLGSSVTVVVNVHDGPGAAAEEAYSWATGLLFDGGVPMLGYVDLGYAARPIADVLTDVNRWHRYPVEGIFFDQVPTGPFGLGPVALAVRHARRSGLATALLNPGVPADAQYRELGAGLCTYEGRWTDYQRWSGEGAHQGDCHLVYGVPAAQLPAAARLLAARGAGFGLVTDLDLPAPYGGLPAWCACSPANHAGSPTPT